VTAPDSRARRAVAWLSAVAIAFLACAALAGGLPQASGASKSAARRGSKAAVTAASPSTTSRPFDFIHGIGLVEGDRKDSLWLMIADSTLAIGDSLTLLSDDPNPEPDTYVTVISAAVAERIPGDPTHKMSPENGDVFYRMVAPPRALDCCIFGYAVRAPRTSFRVVAGRAEADLDGDGVLERFQSCATGEGLRPTVWSGVPFQGVRRWTRYYSLGYTVEPNCPGRDSLSAN
jgi:hypothetical protein